MHKIRARILLKNPFNDEVKVYNFKFDHINNLILTEFIK